MSGGGGGEGGGGGGGGGGVTQITSTCNSSIAYTCTGEVEFIQQNVTATPGCRKCANEQPELGLQSRSFYWLIHTVIATIHAGRTHALVMTMHAKN